MRSRAEWNDVREIFFQVLDRVQSVTLAAQEVGITRARGYRWARKAGFHSVRPGHPGRARYADLRAGGMSQSAAAAAVGAHPSVARDWDYGVRYVDKRRTYPDGPRGDDRYGAPAMESPLPPPLPLASADQVLDPWFLSIGDRIEIADRHAAGESFRAIGRVLGRPASTIKREIDRNPSPTGDYRPHHAHRLAAKRRPRPKVSKLATPGRLRTYVTDRLQDHWSPEQISHSLPREFPDDQELRVSTETIYQAIYVQARGGLKREVKAALRGGRTRRKPHQTADQRRPRFGEAMVLISERPAEAEDRAVPGHWEGDLIIGAHNQSAILTLVERTTRYVLLGHLPQRHTAEAVREVLAALIGTLPEHLRQSLTWDQGTEMAEHRAFSIATDVPVFFCDPASPWQRGSNENTNGLLRQYFPKGTDLSVHGPEELARVAAQLNGRPRKTLDWETPAQRFQAVIDAGTDGLHAESV